MTFSVMGEIEELEPVPAVSVRGHCTPSPQLWAAGQWVREPVTGDRPGPWVVSLSSGAQKQ